MIYKNENKTLYIDIEAVSTLSLAKEGLLYPITTLMDKEVADATDKSREYKGKTFPFSFILAPSGKRNYEVLSQAKKGETITFVCSNTRRKVGEIVVSTIFEIDPQQRVKNIFDTYDMSHPGIKDVLARLGTLAISGDYSIIFEDIKKTKEQIKERQEYLNAKSTTAMMLAAKPLHRVHERVIRQSLEKTDLLVIFLLKPHRQDLFSYELREQTLNNFIEYYLPKNRVLIIPFENTYLFGGNNEVILNSIVANNYGCTHFVLGQNNAGLGLYYDNHVKKSIFDNMVGCDIQVDIITEYVYCNKCKTLVSTKACPHGDHNHIHYNSQSLVQLLENGIIPPAVLVRKEVSATILSVLYPNRFKNLQKLYNDILPSSALIEEHSEEEFYQDLLKLYQTTSLT